MIVNARITLRVLSALGAKQSLYVAIIVIHGAILFYFAGVSHSLALLALGFHFLHHILATVSSTSFTLMGWQSSEPCGNFSYGLQRAQVLATYASGVLLMFTSFAVGMEAIHRAFHTDEVDCTWIPLLSLICFGLVAIGILRAPDPARYRGRRHVIRTLWTVLSSTAPALLAFSMGLAVVFMGFPRFDTTTACAIALLSIRQVLPDLRATSSMLLQRTPEQLLPTLNRILTQVLAMPGVVECIDARFWTLADGAITGTLKLHASPATQEDVILSHVRPLFEPLLTHLTVEVDKNPSGHAGPSSIQAMDVIC